ncbi:6-phosphogluconate dehydrogenase [Candidatus Saccharibacteria bacterium]|nr:MAG: 6-phosphogluconate dehydrogenase [Candidatus Saccharibacteria bacterium]
MKIGFIGVGTMGGQMVRKLCAGKHTVIAHDPDQTALAPALAAGAVPAADYTDLVQQLGKRPIVWLMIPQQHVAAAIEELLQILPAGSTLVDGGNSHFRETMQRAATCSDRKIAYVDVGTSGGILGQKQGFSMMVGGDEAAVKRIKPALHVLSKPKGGYQHVGPSGYGHYVKMVHNGIEYAVMQAYAEGYDLLKYGPLPDIPLPKVADVWQKGSIIASTLNGLLHNILEREDIERIHGRVDSNGEGNWALQTATQQHIGMPGLAAALGVRAASQEAAGDYFATKLLAAMRHEFGGHPIAFHDHEKQS